MDATEEIGNSGNKIGDLRDAMRNFFSRFVQRVRIKKTIRRKRFCFQPNDENKLPIELSTKTCTNLQDINEDCLLKIFSVESLTLLDLCSLAETCSRFQQIVRRYFPVTLEVTLDGIGYSIVSSKYSNSNLKRTWKGKFLDDGIEKILKNFGSTLREIRIRGHENENYMDESSFLLNLMSKYCVDHLRSTDDNMETAEVLTVKSKPTFNRLQVLILIKISIESGFDSFADFDSLTELKVEFVKGYTSILETIFPKLQRFHLKVGQIDEFLFQSFISCHSKLRTLQVHTYAPVSDKILQGICDSCQVLEELNFKCGNELFERQRVLQLSFIGRRFRLRRNSQKAQFLHLTKLRKLCIRGMRDMDVVDIIRQLINLEEFEVGNFTLNEETFAEIDKIVNDRSKVLTLSCDFDFFYNSKNSGEDQKIKLVKLPCKLTK